MLVNLNNMNKMVDDCHKGNDLSSKQPKRDKELIANIQYEAYDDLCLTLITIEITCQLTHR